MLPPTGRKCLQVGGSGWGDFLLRLWALFLGWTEQAAQPLLVIILGRVGLLSIRELRDASFS